MINKRTIQWEGSINFVDEKNDIHCEMKFPEKGLFGLPRGITYDMMTGTIVKENKEVCTVDGSWLSHLCFNGKKYWDLETSDIVLPMRVDKALPSDCRYREDAVALAEGDMELSQSEKERLEVLQRHDKKLRIDNKKGRQH